MNNPDRQRTFRYPLGRVKTLGFAGLLPQLIALILIVDGGTWSWIALASSFAYAALIFSFLGGVWWGQALSKPDDAPGWAFAVAVLPSLIALALFLPWTLGWPWPGPSLFWLGLLIAASPCIDRALALQDASWMRLRWLLSLGLGGLTLIIGLIDLAQRG
ncbi:DUF3429 domain-containing protein [Pontixanthobacter sp.]|uniref:DUF3429 domain-containing protein n=1 Tax=Pontixanthobacter sp. TaxID=2792078 RepID=UPI003C7CA55C